MGGNLNFIAVLGTFWFKNYIPPSNGRRGWGGDPPSNVQGGGRVEERGEMYGHWL